MIQLKKITIEFFVSPIKATTFNYGYERISKKLRQSFFVFLEKKITKAKKDSTFL